MTLRLKILFKMYFCIFTGEVHYLIVRKGRHAPGSFRLHIRKPS